MRNVLYVLFDDLRADLGFGNTASSQYTPTMEQLKRGGASFELAFSQTAFCVPSRASFLTGLRPETTRSVHNDQVERFGAHRYEPLRPGYTVLDAFKRVGYTTAAVGKIFHFGEGHPSLDLPVLPNTHDLLGRPCDGPNAKDVRKPRAAVRFGFPKACQLPFGSFVDERVAAGAIGYLRRLTGHRRNTRADSAANARNADANANIVTNNTGRSSTQRPFLLLVGFMRPHNPYQFPSQYLDRLPSANATDVAMVRSRHQSQPSLAYADGTGCTQRKCTREQVRFYRGAVSHADAMLGLVLRELRKLQIAPTTLVVVHADHGFSLGENGAWQKRSNFDHATRVPLFIRDPTLPHTAGLRVHAPVELTDVLPTLLDLSGATLHMPPPRHLQGRSLRPLLDRSSNANGHTFTHAFMLQPRLLYLSRNTTSRARLRASGTSRALVDGGANVSDVIEPGGSWPTRAKDCSAELVAGGFGPGRSCQFIAMGFSVRSRRWRYTRWERWPIGGDTKRIWTAGEGSLLAEEIYCYGCRNMSTALMRIGGNTDAEQVNLVAPSSKQQLDADEAATVRSAKQALKQALLSRTQHPTSRADRETHDAIADRSGKPRAAS